MTARWYTSSDSCENYECEELIDDGGNCIAWIERCWNATYPWAYDPLQSGWVRGGAYYDEAEAVFWAERVAGLHPIKPEDDRPLEQRQPE